MLHAGHMLMSAGNTVLVAGAQEEVRGSFKCQYYNTIWKDPNNVRFLKAVAPFSN
jgi:hypothetical protein